jgi:hypothetical protein
MNIWNEVVKVTKACNHRLNAGSGFKINGFAKRMLQQISDIEGKVPVIDLSHERNYFLNLLK